ncbi:hypothetical protein WEI85_32735 [Actinomycetes bacterium KLBMP 9797]
MATDLAGEVRAELLSMARPIADTVARHLVATGKLIDEDPELALAHAVAARRLASRVAAVREAVGLAAYHAGEWQTAIGELRTYHRMSGAQTHLAVVADCERALGRPERAVDLFRAADRAKMDPGEAIELLIVASGARGDLGQRDASVAMLQVRELTAEPAEPWTARLRYAYADALLAADRREEAREWFARAAEVDEDASTDAAERLLELDGVVLDEAEDLDEAQDEAEGTAEDAAGDRGADDRGDERAAAAEGSANDAAEGSANDAAEDDDYDGDDYDDEEEDDFDDDLDEDDDDQDDDDLDENRGGEDEDDDLDEDRGGEDDEDDGDRGGEDDDDLDKHSGSQADDLDEDDADEADDDLDEHSGDEDDADPERADAEETGVDKTDAVGDAEDRGAERGDEDGDDEDRGDAHVAAEGSATDGTDEADVKKTGDGKTVES